MDVLNRPIPILAPPCGAYPAHPSVATLPTIATCYLCNIHSHVVLQLAHLNPVLPHSSLVATHNPCEIYLVPPCGAYPAHPCGIYPAPPWKIYPAHPCEIYLVLGEQAAPPQD